MKKTRILSAVIALLLVCSMLMLSSCKWVEQIKDSIEQNNEQNNNEQNNNENEQNNQSEDPNNGEKPENEGPADQAFCAIESMIGEAIQDAYSTDLPTELQKAASIKIALDNALLGGKYELGAAYDFDAKKANIAFDGTIKGLPLSIRLYADDASYAVQSSTLFEGTYGFNTTTFEEDFEGSYLAELMDDEETRAMFLQAVELIGELQKGELLQSLSTQKAPIEKIKNDLRGFLNARSKTVSLQSFNLYNGTVDGFKVTFELTSKDFVDLTALLKTDLTDIYESLGNTLSQVAQLTGNAQSLTGSLDEITRTLDQISEMFEEDLPNFKMTLDVGIKALTGEAVCFDLTVYSDATEGQAPDATFAIDLGANPTKSEKYLMTGFLATGNEDIEISSEYQRVTTSGQFKRELNMKVKETGSDGKAEEHSLQLSLDHNKTTGKFVLRFSTKDEQTGKIGWDYQLSGKLFVAKDSLELALDTLTPVSSNLPTGQSVAPLELGLSIEIATENVQVLDVPEYQNICALTESDLKALEDEIKGNVSGAISGDDDSISAEEIVGSYTVRGLTVWDDYKNDDEDDIESISFTLAVVATEEDTLLFAMSGSDIDPYTYTVTDYDPTDGTCTFIDEMENEIQVTFSEENGVISVSMIFDTVFTGGHMTGAYSGTRS